MSACSSAGDVSGPEATLPSEASSVEEESVNTTAVEREGLAAVLDGESPSTTVSEDPDEQAAADVVHWERETFSGCLEDTPNCVLADFEETSSGRHLERQKAWFAEKKRVGVTSETDLPSERTIFWARRSSSTDKVVGVLECSRNYYVASKPNGEILDDTSPTFLHLRRVVLGDDGRWRIDDRFEIESFQSSTDGGDTCLTFDGSEADSLFDDLMQ